MRSRALFLKPSKYKLRNNMLLENVEKEFGSALHKVQQLSIKKGTILLLTVKAGVNDRLCKKNIILSFTVNRRKTSDEMALFAAISKVAVAAPSAF